MAKTNKELKLNMSLAEWLSHYTKMGDGIWSDAFPAYHGSIDGQAL